MSINATTLDRRLNAYRPDLADERLRGQVEASRFVAGTPMQVSAPVVDLRAEPRMDSGPQTQMIFGDKVRVFEDMDGWCWVQAERDGYVGYVSAASLEGRTVMQHIWSSCRAPLSIPVPICTFRTQWRYRSAPA